MLAWIAQVLRSLVGASQDQDQIQETEMFLRSEQSDMSQQHGTTLPVHSPVPDDEEESGIFLESEQGPDDTQQRERDQQRDSRSSIQSFYSSRTSAFTLLGSLPSYITFITPWSPPSSRSSSPPPSSRGQSPQPTSDPTTQPTSTTASTSAPTTSSTPPSSAPTTSSTPPSSAPAIIITQHRNQPNLEYLDILAIGSYAFASSTFISASFAVKDGGWFSYFLLLLLVAVAAFCNSLDLGRCCTTQRQTYMDVGTAAFPRVGGPFCWMLTFLLSFSTCIGTLMVQKDNLQYILPHRVISDDPTKLGFLLTFVLMGIFLIIVCVCTIREECSWIPGVGIILMIIMLICLLEIKSNTSVDDGFQRKSDTVWFNMSKIHTTFGFFAYFYSGHGCLPLVYTSMRSKQYYRHMVAAIFLFSTSFYIAVSYLGYSMFGSNVKESFTLNLSLESKVSYLVITCSILNQGITYLINVSSMTRQLDDLLPQQGIYAGIRKYLIRIFLVLVTGIFVIFEVFVNELYVKLVSFTGCTVGVLMALIVPTLCSHLLNGSNIWRLGFLLAFGCVGAILTTFTSIKDMI